MRLAHVLMFVVAFLLVGCDQASSVIDAVRPSPSSALDDYISALEGRRYGEAYAMLSREDRSELSEREYRERMDDNYSQLATFLGHEDPRLANHFEVIDAPTIVEPGQAVGSIKVTSPDREMLSAEVMRTVFASAMRDMKSGVEQTEEENKKEMADALKKFLDEEEVLTVSTTRTVRVILESDVWKVHENFARANRIAAMMDKAKRLADKSNYVEAVSTYNEVLQEDPDNEAALAELDDAEMELAEESKKQDYIDKSVELFELEAKRIDTYGAKNVPAVRFALRNNGDHTLGRVVVTVYFQDANDVTIFEKSYAPISPYGGDPLKPNYIHREKEGTYYTIEELGKEWKEGAARAVVTDIEFAGDS